METVMHLGRASLRRSVTVAAVATALASPLLAVFATADVAVAAPAYTLDERATAIASPSLVYLEVRVEGYLRVRTTGALVESTPVTVARPCSGFVVRSDGYLVTATHCIQPSQDSLRGAAAYLVANDLVKDKKLTTAAKAGYIQQLMSTTDFTGATAGATLTPKIYGQLFAGTGGLTDKPASAGQVVGSQPVTASDVALVKLDATGLPVAQLDTAAPSTNAHVVQIAFGTDNANATPPAYTVRTRSSVVEGRYGTSSPPIYKMDGDLGTAAYGGMVVNGDGHVIGMINADTKSKNRVNELITGASAVDGMLAKAGITNQQTATDQAYEAGLDAYYAGRYDDAIKDFDTVLAAEPGQKVAQDFLKQAQERRTIEGGSGTAGSGTPTWLLLVLAGLGGVLVTAVIVTVVTVIRRSRRRRQERERYAPDPFAPISGAPVSSPGLAFPVSGGGALGYPPPPFPPAAFQPPSMAAPYQPPPMAVPAADQPFQPVADQFPTAPASGQPFPPFQPAPDQPFQPAADQFPTAPASGQPFPPFQPAADQFPTAPASGQPFQPAPGQPFQPVSGQPFQPAAPQPPTAPASGPPFQPAADQPFQPMVPPAPPFQPPVVQPPPTTVVPPVQYQAGVPTPVTPPTGIPVRSPNWQVRAPVQLPEMAPVEMAPVEKAPEAPEAPAAEPAAEQAPAAGWMPPQQAGGPWSAPPGSASGPAANNESGRPDPER
jgi:hypothetical protein